MDTTFYLYSKCFPVKNRPFYIIFDRISRNLREERIEMRKLVINLRGLNRRVLLTFRNLPYKYEPYNGFKYFPESFRLTFIESSRVVNSRALSFIGERGTRERASELRSSNANIAEIYEASKLARVYRVTRAA